MSTLAMSPAAEAIRSRLMSVTSTDEITALSKALWQGFTTGQITEAESEALDAAIAARRPRSHGSSLGLARPILHRFTPRRRQSSPDREASKRRRRRLASPMPGELGEHFTQGETAALVIVAGEIKHHGVCDLPIDHIAALAGIGRTTVQNALHEARRRGLIKITYRPRRGAKNLPNLIEIVHPEWRAWIKRGPVAHRPIGSKTRTTPKFLNPTKSTEKKIPDNKALRSRPCAAGRRSQACGKKEETFVHLAHSRRMQID